MHTKILQQQIAQKVLCKEEKKEGKKGGGGGEGLKRTVLKLGLSEIIHVCA